MTLIEVMLALAVIGIGMFALIAAASQCISVVRAARLYNHAHMLIGRVDLIQPIDNEQIQPGIERGRFDGDFSQYEWSREIEIVGEEEDGLYQIATRVIWSRRGKQSFEEIVTYRYVQPEE